MSRPGQLKIYLGYAAGVGKTYRMLEEAQALRAKDIDVVIGYFEPHGRQETIDKTEGLETVPRRAIQYGGTRFEEMDLDAVLRRKPAVAVVDEFAHSNIPGSGNEKRWQDVHALLDAGINVLTTMNVQHLESLNDQVWQVTGVRVRETVPDWVVDEADEVVLVDLTPRALRNRIDRGVVYASEKARRALDNFFTEANLTALRELAIRHTAHEVEDKLLDPRREERILICLTGRPSSANLIRRGKRVADYLQGDCLAVHVAPGAVCDENVRRHMSFARNLRIETHVLEGEDVPSVIAEFARSHKITQIFMGRSSARPWWKRFGETVVQRMVRLARDMQITIVAERRR
uniref:Osmosensitive K+ channel His kinase sensor n=1 Tax=Solibacter usitatus (strain Ellin6076) TaxID=234267 RepID=Q02CX3_SOLUE